MIDNHKFYKLEREIERGGVCYAIKFIFPALSGVLIGKFISMYFFEYNISFENLQNEFLLTTITLIIFGYIFGVISWNLKKLKYQKEVKYRNNT